MMMMRTLLAVAAAAGLLLPTTAAALDEITNPTGSCTSDYDDSTRVHVPDCNNPLQREYWRVFLREDQDDASLAYILPRPDGMGTKYGLCDEALFQRYALCTGMTTEAVETINNIPLEDALAITHTLHGKLVFEAVQNGEDYWSISPYADKNDIFAVCDAGLATENVLAHCQALRDLCDEDGNCMEMAILPSEATVKDLVPALNELYGISVEADDVDPVALSLDEALPSCSNVAETYDCNVHPRAEDDYAVNGTSVTFAVNGTLDVNVTDDESCLEGCTRCLGDRVRSAKLRIKQVGAVAETAAEYYACACGFGDGEPVIDSVSGQTTEGRIYVDLCDDAGFQSSGVGAAGFSGTSVLGVTALVLASWVL